ncbi:MAG TPA: vWA domain-containing protein [Nannocystis sp.]
MKQEIHIASIGGVLALGFALALPACTLPTKLGDFAETGDTEDPTATSTSGGGSGTTIGDDPDPTGSTGAGSAGTSGDPACTPAKVTHKPLRPNVVLVLDKSGSMVAPDGGTWDHDGDPNTPDVTRWWSLHAAVAEIVSEFELAIDFGAHLFPSVAAKGAYNATSCPVDPEIDIPVAPANAAAILAGIPAADDDLLMGGTPMAAGVTVALDHLRSLDPKVPRAIMLVTDGAANCAVGAEPPALFESYDDSVHAIVGDAFALEGIPTYVVGVGIADEVTPEGQDGTPDGINPFEKLNELAILGGKPKDHPDEKFYNTENGVELAAALKAITFDALSCIVPLDPPLVAPEGLAVEIDGEPIPQVAACDGGSGWTFTNPEGPFDAIELCGSACMGLKLAGEADITVCVEH